MTIMLERAALLEESDEAAHFGIRPKKTDAQRRYWSSIDEIYELLKINEPVSAEQSALRFQHMKFKAGSTVCVAGNPCDTFFLVYAGFLKISWIAPSGNEKILGFPMKGDLAGLDGIFSTHFSNTLTALSDTEIILIPKELVIDERMKIGALRTRLLLEFSNALLASQKVEYMMGQLTAEARVAKFLLSHSQQFKKIGFSEKAFHLRMTRQDIGSYLGVTLETVSRALSRFARRGYIKVDQKFIELVDIQALRALRRLSLGHDTELD